MKTQLSILYLLVTSFAVACHTKERAAHPAPPADKPELTYGLTKEQQKQPIVSFGNRIMTLRQFAERLRDLPPYQAARHDSPERRRQFLDDLVRLELLATEAEKRGYDKRADVERVKQRTMVEQMMRDLFDEQGTKLSDVSDREIQEYYARNRHEFGSVTQARGVIQNRLWRAKREAAVEQFVAGLRSSAEVKENLDLLSKVRIHGK